MAVNANTLFVAKKNNSGYYPADKGLSGNPWTGGVAVGGNLQKLIKSIENYDLYKMDINDKTKAISVKLDVDNNYEMGFGVHHCRADVNIHYKFSKTKYTKFTVVSPSTLTGKEQITSGAATNYWKDNMVCVPTDKKSAIRQLHDLSDSVMTNFLEMTWTAMKKISGFKNYDNVMDHELAAIADIAHNTGIYIGTGSSTQLTADFVAHQNGKGGANETVLRDKVCATILRYRTAKGVIKPGLEKRRVFTAEMYKGSVIVYDVSTISDASVKTYYAGKGITSTSTSYEGGVDKTSEATTAALYTLAGSNAKEATEAVLSEDYATQKKILSEIGARNLDKIQKENEKMQKGNPTSSIYTAPEKTYGAFVVQPVTDSRALSGKNMPERPVGTAVDGDSVSSRISTNRANSIGRFRKYGQVLDDDLGQLKKTLFFMTRPDMCIYQNTSIDHNESNLNYLSPSLQCGDPDLIDLLVVDRDLYIYLDRHIRPHYLDTNIAFIPQYTNQFRTTNLPETSFEMNKSASNIQGVSVSLPTYNSADTVESSFTVTFNNDDHLSILKYNDLIFKYAKSIKEKTTIAYPESIKYNVLDFSTTIFMFIVGQDGVTLESFYRSVGVVPMTNPISTLPLSSIGEKADTVNITFKPNTPLDSRKLQIINHFNFLNRMGCSSIPFDGTGNITTYDAAINWFMMNYNVLESFILENMWASDWHVERYQVFLDMDNERNVYKIVGIPTVERMKSLISFIAAKASESKNNMYKSILSGNGTTDRYRLLKQNTSTYKKYTLTTTSRDDEFSTYKYLQMHLDTSVKDMISDARSQPQFYKGVLTGQREFGESNKKDISGTGINALYYLDNPIRLSNTLGVTSAIAAGEPLAHLISFLKFGNMVYDKTSKSYSTKTDTEMNETKMLSLVDYMVLGHLHLDATKTHINVKDTYTKLTDNEIVEAFTENGLFIKDDYKLIDSKYVKQTPHSQLNHGMLHSSETTAIHDGKVIRATNWLMDRDISPKTDTKKHNDILSIMNKSNKELYKSSDITISLDDKNKDLMKEVAPRGLFLVPDPIETTTHGDVKRVLEVAIDKAWSAFVESQANYDIRRMIFYDGSQAYLNELDIPSTHANSLQRSKHEHTYFVEAYWRATRSTGEKDSSGNTKFEKDILDPTKWFIAVQSSGRTYSPDSGKMPYIDYISTNTAQSDKRHQGQDTLMASNSRSRGSQGSAAPKLAESASEEDKETKYTAIAYTTLAKIMRSKSDVTTDNEKKYLVTTNTSGGTEVIRHGTLDKDRNNFKVSEDIPLGDTDFFTSNDRVNYISLMDSSVMVPAISDNRWLGLYLTDRATGKVITSKSTMLYGKEAFTYKILASMYYLGNEENKATSNVVQYSSKGMTTITPSRDAAAQSFETYYTYVLPEGADGNNLYAKYTKESNRINKSEALLPAGTSISQESKSLKGWKKWGTIIAESVKETLISSAKTWLYQNLSNVLTTTITKLLTNTKVDRRNGEAAPYSVKDLDYAKFSRDMRSNYKFTVADFANTTNTEVTTMQIDGITDTNTYTNSMQVADFVQERIIAPEYQFSEIEYVSTNTTPIDIMFGSSSTSLQVEKTSANNLDLLINSLYPEISGIVSKLQAEVDSSTTNILMKALQSSVF